MQSAFIDICGDKLSRVSTVDLRDPYNTESTSSLSLAIIRVGADHSWHLMRYHSHDTFVEISSICVHPSTIGREYGRQLCNQWSDPIISRSCARNHFSLRYYLAWDSISECRWLEQCGSCNLHLQCNLVLELSAQTLRLPRGSESFIPVIVFYPLNYSRASLRYSLAVAQFYRALTVHTVSSLSDRTDILMVDVAWDAFTKNK